jgi:putative MATE family efflux protein
MDRILVLLGASEETMAYTRTYLSIVNLCGIFSIISNCYTNVVRAEGHSTAAMAGTLIGNLFSVILDPIMILMLGWGIAGAAIATVIGNAVAAVYYIVYYLKGSSELSISLKDFSVKDHIASSVLAIGIPASLTSILMSISQMITNSRMAAYGDMAVAGYGVSSKVLMIVTLAGIGVGQGIQPVLGYFYGSHDEKRFKACLKSGLLAGIILTGSLCILCWLFTGQLVQLFLSDQAAYSYGFAFTRIMLTTSWLFGIFYVLMNGLQAVGAAGPSLAVAVCRQGLIYIPCVFLFEKLIGVNGLAWAQPAADVLSLLLAAVLFHRTVRTIESERKTAPEEA